MSESDENTIEVSYDKYQRMREARSQCIGEGWIDVVRIDDETVRARPVDRQEGRVEGGYIESDSWLIEDVNGETYTIDEATFEEKYDPLVTKTFVMDLSTDRIETEEDEPDIAGTDVVVEMTAQIDLTRDVVTHLFVDRVSYDGTELEALPLEALADHPKVSQQTDREESEDDV